MAIGTTILCYCSCIAKLHPSDAAAAAAGARHAASASGGSGRWRWKKAAPDHDCGAIAATCPFPRMVLPVTGVIKAPEAPCVIRRLASKGDQTVLAQLLALEKKLFKKQDNWGDLLIKETQRRNTFLLYAEAIATTAATAAAAAAEEYEEEQERPGAGDPTVHPAAPAVVGYIFYTATGLNAHISKLAVATEWRRRGIARALVRAAVQSAASERRVCSVSLHVDADNSAALGLYRGEGFESEALLEDYCCRGRHAHKMRLDLPDSQ